MLTRERVIRIRLSDDFAGRRLRNRSTCRRVNEARRLLRSEVRACFAECDPLTDAALSETMKQPSYACKLYAASAT